MYVPKLFPRPTVSRFLWVSTSPCLLTLLVLPWLGVVGLETNSVRDRFRDTERSDVTRFWGIPDLTAQVGKLFNFSVPGDAFSGQVDHYEVTEAGRRSLPEWLHFDRRSHTLQGVPTEKDIGQLYISIKAVGPSPELGGKPPTAKDVFSIEVVEEQLQSTQAVPLSIVSQPLRCPPGEAFTVASLAVDADVDGLASLDRASLLSKLASFVRLPVDQLKLSPESGKGVDRRAVLAGPGNARARRFPGAVFQWKVGCSGDVHSEHVGRVSDVERAAADGNLADLLGLPVVGWQVTGVQPDAVLHRDKRRVWETPVPAVVPAHPTVTEQIDDDADATDDSAIPESRIVPTMASPVLPEPSVHPHPHRHHHGEGSAGDGRQQPSHRQLHVTASPTLSRLQTGRVRAAVSTPVPVPDRPTEYATAETSYRPTPSRSFPDELTPVDALMSSMSVPVGSTAETEALPSRTYFVSSEVTSETIRPTKSVAPTEPTKKPAGPPNFKPTINNRIKKLSMIAGKVWSYQIPRDTFLDFEDQDTRNLKLIFMTAERTAIPSTSWIQFDPEKQTLYALPLDDNIGKYEFILEAMDSEDDSIYDKLDIHVWQHPSARAVHHAFALNFKYNKWQFPVGIDWQIAVVRKLSQLYGDGNESYVTVQSVTSDPISITWTNDSLPNYPCPKEAVSLLARRLFSEDGKKPSRQLREAMNPEFRVQNVSVAYLGVCRPATSTTASTRENDPPKLRNSIKQINTTVGEILRYKVPDDTFFDEEDGSTRYLTLTFLTMDSLRPPKSFWVQFDPKSQELYGLPFESDVGHHEFRMVSVDSNGQEASDSFIVVVQARPPKKWSVEFSLHLDHDFDAFDRDISKKVLVAWKLAKLYGDPDPRYITVGSVSRGSVVYAWTNSTLPHDPCPKERIARLVKYLFSENGTISARLVEAMQPEFKIVKADAMPLGICLGEVTPTTVRAATPPTTPQESEPAATGDDDIYITTIIPAVVIAVMLVVAAMVACFLYRKKRKGKMTMNDNGTFMSKGVPIIFAGELEDKPDPAKPPAIIRDEKPPLLAADFGRPSAAGSRDSTPLAERRESGHPRDTSADLHPDPGISPPYQPPPPPFTAGRENKNARPKAAPTYRQPPPYVPP